MCGIAGWFGRANPTLPDDRRIGAMTAALGHRGPDGSGTLALPGAVLGHTRLAIIDPRSGQQPMRTPDSGVVISFNGEIYNFRELRRELAAQGFRFRTECDTEVIIALYVAGGWPALARLRGMYALALWDERQDTGFLARDPLGIKPLFVTSVGDCLAFGSEAKALIAGGFVTPELDERSLHLLLNFRYLPGERSLFRGVSQLAPGEVVCWQPDGMLRRHRLPPPGAAEAPTVACALEDSVQSHLVADVEVAGYLSGGIDSALVMAMARRHLPRPPRTFTLAVGDDPREALNAAESAQLLGVPNAARAAEQPSAEDVAGVVRALEVPKVNALQVAQLARFAASQVKVVLSGLGGDELFYGYTAYGILNRAAKIGGWTPRAARVGLGRSTALLLDRLPGLPWSEAERAFRMLAELGSWPKVYGLLRNVWDSPALRRQIYGPRLLDAELPDAFQVLASLWPDEPDPVAAAARFEWRNKMVNDLLWQEDRLSMAAGLEVRVPFVDAPLAGYVQGQSRSSLMPRGRLKAGLRDVAAECLPATILSRPKSGFQVDSPSFFRSHLTGLAELYLNPARLAESGLFNPRFVRRVAAAPPARRHRWHYFMLYLMLMTEIWLDVFTPHPSETADLALTR